MDGSKEYVKVSVLDTRLILDDGYQMTEEPTQEDVFRILKEKGRDDESSCFVVLNSSKEPSKCLYANVCVMGLVYVRASLKARISKECENIAMRRVDNITEKYKMPTSGTNTLLRIECKKKEENNPSAFFFFKHDEEYRSQKMTLVEGIILSVIYVIPIIVEKEYFEEYSITSDDYFRIQTREGKIPNTKVRGEGHKFKTTSRKRKGVEGLSDLSVRMLTNRLNKCVEKEQYEEAVKIREEIKRRG